MRTVPAICNADDGLTAIAGDRGMRNSQTCQQRQQNETEQGFHVRILAHTVRVCKFSLRQPAAAGHTLSNL